MTCKACQVKDKLIESLLDRLSQRSDAIPVEGPSLIEQLADQVVEDEDAEAAREESSRMSKAIIEKYRELHLGDPYSGCKIVKQPEN